MNTWIIAARPKTLIASISPVLIGSALAIRSGSFSTIIFLATLLTALLIQIGSNYANDYFDCIKGADTAKRKGPLRVTAAGLVTHAAMKRAIIVVYALLILCGSYLIYIGGPAIAILVALSILLGILYTAGPYPLGYLGIADIFVLVFFGPVSTAGAYYLQTHTFSWEAVLVGFGPGALSSAILVINNLRDIEEDRTANKMTLPARFGRQFGKMQYMGCLALAFLTPLFSQPRTITADLMLFPAFFAAKTVWKHTDGFTLIPIFAKTGLLLWGYTLLFCLGIFL